MFARTAIQCRNEFANALRRFLESDSESSSSGTVALASTTLGLYFSSKLYTFSHVILPSPWHEVSVTSLSFAGFSLGGMVNIGAFATTTTFDFLDLFDISVSGNVSLVLKIKELDLLLFCNKENLSAEVKTQ